MTIPEDVAAMAGQLHDRVEQYIVAEFQALADQEHAEQELRHIDWELEKLEAIMVLDGTLKGNNERVRKAELVDALETSPEYQELQERLRQVRKAKHQAERLALYNRRCYNLALTEMAGLLAADRAERYQSALDVLTTLMQERQHAHA